MVKYGTEIISLISKKVRKIHDITSGINEFNIPELSFDTYKRRKTLLNS